MSDNTSNHTSSHTSNHTSSHTSNHTITSNNNGIDIPAVLASTPVFLATSALTDILQTIDASVDVSTTSTDTSVEQSISIGINNHNNSNASLQYESIQNFINYLHQNNINEIMQIVQEDDNTISLVFNIEIPADDSDDDMIIMHNTHHNHNHNHNNITKKCNKRQRLAHLGRYQKISSKDPLLAENQTCAICLDGYKYGEFKRTMTKCTHIFHKKCIDKWLADSKKMHCPVCRTSYDNNNNCVTI